MAAEPEPVTALAVVRPQSAVANPLPDRDEWQTMSSIANALAKARGFIPAHFQGDGYKVLAAIMYGRDLGLSPTVAIQHIIVIDGKATADAQLIGYLIRRAGHRLTDKTTPTGSTVTLTRTDGSTHEATFTIDMAKRAGLVRSGGAWEKYPESMVYARALTMVARKGAQDALLGVVYTPEELGADVAEDGSVTRLPAVKEFQGAVIEVPTTEEIPAEKASPESRAAVEAAGGEPQKESPPARPTPAPSPAAPTEERARRGIGPRPKAQNVVTLEPPQATPDETDPEQAPLPEPPPEAATGVSGARTAFDGEDSFEDGLDPLREDIRTLAAQLKAKQRNRRAALEGREPEALSLATPNEESDKALATFVETVYAGRSLGDLNEEELGTVQVGLSELFQKAK